MLHKLLHGHKKVHYYYGCLICEGLGRTFKETEKAIRMELKKLREED